MKIYFQVGNTTYPSPSFCMSGGPTLEYFVVGTTPHGRDEPLRTSSPYSMMFRVRQSQTAGATLSITM